MLLYKFFFFHWHDKDFSPQYFIIQSLQRLEACVPIIMSADSKIRFSRMILVCSTCYRSISLKCFSHLLSSDRACYANCWNTEVYAAEIIMARYDARAHLQQNTWWAGKGARKGLGSTSPLFDIDILQKLYYLRKGD